MNMDDQVESGRLNVRYCSLSGFGGAVELSIAASEALVIHELVETEIDAEAVLEAALKMKKARVKGLKDALHQLGEEIDEEMDSLSDLDDSTMMEAFEDVGLLCGSDVYVVKDIPVSDGRGNHGNVQNRADVMAQEKKKNQSFAPSVDQTSEEEISQFSRTEEEVIYVPAQLQRTNGIKFLKRVVQETSFLSESRDVAPDENSLLQKYESGFQLASQQSVQFEGFCNRVDEPALSFREAVDSDQSFVDPLCSLVPCSIPPENESSFLALDHKMKGSDAENCFGSIPRLGMESLHENCQAVPVTTSDSAESLVRRQFISMRAYSTLVSKDEVVRCPEVENFGSLLPLKPMCEYVIGRENEENGQNLKENSKILPEEKPLVILDVDRNLDKLQAESKDLSGAQVPVRKRVRFSEVWVEHPREKVFQKLQASRFATWRSKRAKYSNSCPDSRIPDSERCLTAHQKHQKRLVFQGMEFLLTGFSNRKEKEIEQLIWKYSGVVLSDIPSPCSTSRGRRRSKSGFRNLPIILCPKKLQTTKFLYGCAVNTFILKAKWVTASIAAGSVVPPEKYMIIFNQVNLKCARIGKLVCRSNPNAIFDGVGIMLYGKQRFCTNLSIIVKHGGGHNFKCLHLLVQSLDSEKISIGAIIAENESRVSRHLMQCALEKKIPVMRASWIVKSLYSGKLLPFKENEESDVAPAIVEPYSPSPGWSEEI